MTDVNDLAKLAAKRAKDVLSEAVGASAALAAAITAENEAKAAQAAARAQLKKSVAAAANLGFTEDQLRELGVNLDTISGRRPTTKPEPSEQPAADRSSSAEPHLAAVS